MTSRQRNLIGSGVLFLLIFIYRFAFRSDFQIIELIQITGNAVLDVLLVNVLFRGWLWLKGRIELLSLAHLKFLPVVILVVGYAIGVVVMKVVHRLVYDWTGTMTEDFDRVFNTLSYQIFDSYLVLAFGLIMLGLFTLYHQWEVQKAMTAQVERERTLAELNYLKAQINPHFIFNTLNNVHFMIEDSNERARKLILDFCDLLRYQLYETGQQEVSLSKDVAFLKTYVQIQEVRKEEGFTTKFDVSGIGNQKIAPLLLIVPVENAFKFSPADETGYVHVNLMIENGELVLFVENSISDKVRADATTGGLGIDNLKKRLQLIYRENAHFELLQNQGIAKSVLRIQLDARDVT